MWGKKIISIEYDEWEDHWEEELEEKEDIDSSDNQIIHELKEENKILKQRVLQKQIDNLNKKLNTDYTVQELKDWGMTPKEVEIMHLKFYRDLSKTVHLLKNKKIILNMLEGLSNYEFEELSEKSQKDTIQNLIEIHNATLSLGISNPKLRGLLESIKFKLEKILEKKPTEEIKFFIEEILDNINQYLKNIERYKGKYYNGKNYYRHPSYDKLSEIIKREKGGKKIKELSEIDKIDDLTEYQKYLLYKKKLIHDIIKSVKTGRKLPYSPLDRQNYDSSRSRAYQLAKKHSIEEVMFDSLGSEETRKQWLEEHEKDARNQLESDVYSEHLKEENKFAKKTLEQHKETEETSEKPMTELEKLADLFLKLEKLAEKEKQLEE